MRHTLSATWNSMKMKPLLQLLLGVASSLSLCLSGITPLPIFQQVPALVLTEGLMCRTMMAMKNRRNHYINSAVEPPRRSPVVPRKELMCKIHRRDRGLKTLGHRRGLRLIRDWMLVQEDPRAMKPWVPKMTLKSQIATRVSSAILGTGTRRIKPIGLNAHWILIILKTPVLLVPCNIQIH